MWAATRVLDAIRLCPPPTMGAMGLGLGKDIHYQPLKKSIMIPQSYHYQAHLALELKFKKHQILQT